MLSLQQFKGARSRVGKKKNQQTQLDFFQRKGITKRSSLSDHPPRCKALLEETSLPMDVNFLLRSQIQKRKPSILIERTQVDLKKPSQHLVEESIHEPVDEVEFSGDEALDNISKYFLTF